MSDFAKASMLGLITRQLEKTNPELRPGASINTDAVRNAQIPADKKRNFLDLVWHKAGPEVLLSIGQGVCDVGYDPIWYDAVRAENPHVLFEKWRRFEAFGHSRNRLRIEYDGEKFASFERYATHGDSPTTPENLLICGLIIALLEAIGCQDLRCDMPLGNGSAHRIRNELCFDLPEEFNLLDTTRWTIEWRKFSAVEKKSRPEQTLPGVNFAAACNLTQRNWVNSVVRLLMDDVSRQWKVDGLARLAGLSKRSLQRRLHALRSSVFRTWCGWYASMKPAGCCNSRIYQ